jgi:hypothetical protein
MPPINFRQLKPKHLTPEGYPEFADMWREAIAAINALQGVNGPAKLLANLDMNGNSIVNLGAPPAGVTTAALSQATADPMYSTSVQQAAMEIVGTKMLQTTRRLNDGTQQHTISSDLNTQGSGPPSNITGTLAYTTVAGSSITWTWTSIIIQLADLSYIGVQNGTLTVTGLSNVAYNFYPYYDTQLGILSFVASNASGNGVPPIAYLTGMSYAAINTAAAQQQTADGRISLTAGAFLATINGTGGSAGLRSR